MLEGLLEDERAGRAAPQVGAAPERGHEYLLERNLMSRLTTGELANPHFVLFEFPPATATTCCAGSTTCAGPGCRPIHGWRRPRTGDQQAHRDGRWNLDDADLGDLGFGFGEEIGQPSRWITLKALRVLRNFG